MANIYFFINLTFLILGIGCSNTYESPITITNLRCEYLKTPLGIDTEQPRLSWELISEERGQNQSAYQIIVASDVELLKQGKADLWDSGKVKSNQTNQVMYNGEPLKSRQYCYWKIKIWDDQGNASSWSNISYWSMGLLDKSDWKAKWIGAKPQIIPKEKKMNNHHGYRSGVASSAEETQWIIIDLGKIQPISEIRLYPVQPLKNSPWQILLPDESENAKAYLFPERFSIEVSEDEDFKTSKTISDQTNEDFIQIGHKPYVKKFKTERAQYIRIKITKLPQIEVGQYSYPERLLPDTGDPQLSMIKSPGFAFALAELEVINSSGKNIALNKKVKVSDNSPALQPFTVSKWSKELLVDGFYKVQSGMVNSIPIPPSPLLRKEFSVEKKVQRAVVYVSALGLYELTINGEKVGDHILAPEWTDYHTRVQYQTYDVTDLIKGGGNAIAAMLADGWYAGAIFSHPDRGSYGFNRRLLAQLEIQYSDGTKKSINTDESWKIFENGPIQRASIFNGELYDANLDQNGWDKPGFNDVDWDLVTVDNTIDIHLNAQMNEPIAVVETISPLSVFKSREGGYIFDFGQNIAGWAELNLPYKISGEIGFRYGEMLNEDSTLYVANLRGAKQTNTYIASENEKVKYEPRFTYHGFRYVEISGLLKPPLVKNINAKVVASSSPIVGNFESSHKNINKLWENILWTQLDNMHSAPTDCPQRDERAGWMGDAQVFSQTSMFNMDMAAFFTKWMRDVRDSQMEDGRFPDWAPHVGVSGHHYNSPGWADAGIIIPWRMYQNYGDTKVLEDQYPAMKKFIQHILGYNPELIWRYSRGELYGDWLNGDDIIYDDYPKKGGKVPNDVYSTAFFAYSTQILSQIASVLNKNEDARYYESLAKNIRQAFIDEFITEDGEIPGSTQAGYALALSFNLVPEKLKEKVAANMVEAVKAYDYRMSTGIQTTIRLMNQLSKFGYNDIAYRLLESRRFPSWLYSVEQGSTTIWERWDGYVEGRGFQNPGMNSFNHYAIGAVGEWMYRHILGINYDETNPGYRQFIIKPVPGGSIDRAKGSYHSIVGNIAVSWKKTNNNFLLEVEVPVNTSAVVYLPTNEISKTTEGGIPIKLHQDIESFSIKSNQIICKVGSGKYSFEINNN